MVAFLIHGLLAALCLAGWVLAQEQPETVPEPVPCTQMKKKACRLDDRCVWRGRRGGCEAATNICSAIQVRKNGQNKRARCGGMGRPPWRANYAESDLGICECKRSRGRCGPCRPKPTDAGLVGDAGPNGCWPGGTVVGPACDFGNDNCCGACNPGVFVSYCCPRGKDVCYKPGHDGSMEAYCSHCADGTCDCE